MLHKPIEKNWNNLEFKPHGLSLGSLAREGITVIHTSASYFPIQNFSLGTLPEHFTSKLSVPTPFIIERRSFASSQKFRRRKMTTTQMRLKGEIRGAALPSSHWAWPHQMRFEHDNCCWQLQAIFFWQVVISTMGEAPHGAILSTLLAFGVRGDYIEQPPTELIIPLKKSGYTLL